jgi:hypothetical protein
MPVTHGVAGSSPVQTAKIGKRFSAMKTFFAQQKYPQDAVLFKKSIQSSCVVFAATL